MDGWMDGRRPTDSVVVGCCRLPSASERASLVRSVGRSLLAWSFGQNIVRASETCVVSVPSPRPSAAAVLEANSNRANDDRTTNVLPS